jgi:hypothetical protein
MDMLKLNSPSVTNYYAESQKVVSQASPSIDY